MNKSRDYFKLLDGERYSRRQQYLMSTVVLHSNYGHVLIITTRALREFENAI